MELLSDRDRSSNSLGAFWLTFELGMETVTGMMVKPSVEHGCGQRNRHFVPFLAKLNSGVDKRLENRRLPLLAIAAPSTPRRPAPPERL